MTDQKVKLGRPRQGEQVKSGAERARDAKKKRKRLGRKTKEFVLSPDSYKLFEQMRIDAGFSDRESSQFFEAMLLKVAGKPWHGPVFELPIERGNDGN
ncbi:hypothetical protein [Vibrio campbellii]|uniref:hypothetical protein n=1 Tax=Vibrio campbellii TaxID=680 RepID=UPI001F222107|nr:hypothetical protein [Vibrio campbellii]MCE7729642.1 hypothetical protein [Vibrio campbellii]